LQLVYKSQILEVETFSKLEIWRTMSYATYLRRLQRTWYIYFGQLHKVH